MGQTLAGILDPQSYAFSVHSLLSMLVGVIFCVYAIYVLAGSRGSRVGSAFAIFGTSVGIWLVGFGFVYASSTPKLALSWIKLSYIAVTFMPALGLIFACTVVGREARLRHITLPALVLSAFFLVTTLATDLIIDGTYHHYWGFYPRLGVLGIGFILYLVATFLFVLYLFWSAQRGSTSQRARKRHHGLVIAFVVAPLGASDFLGTFGIPVYPFGYITTAIALFWIAFVNTRYGFLDITPELAAGQILETMQGAVTVVDKDGRIRVVNRAAQELLGRGRSELIGTSLVSLIDLPKELRIQSAGAMPIRDLEMSWNAPDGRPFVIGISASPLRDSMGSLVGVVYVASDITERKRVEERLRESEERYRATLKSMTDLVFVLDKAGRFVDCHAPDTQDLYVTPSGFIGKRLSEVLPPELAARLEGAIDEIRGGGPVQRLDYEIEIGGQRTAWSANVCPRRDEAGGYDGATIVTRDMTERRLMEERLHQSEKLTAIGQLAGGIAHDFNNQLTGIMGHADMLAARLDEGPLKHYAQSILVSARRAADLTQQLLAFGRKGRYLSVPVDVHRLLAEVVAILERSIDKRIRIAQILRAQNPVTLGDPTQLQNALLNVALNARDAMPQGGDLCFETQVMTIGPEGGADCSSELTAGTYLSIRIADTGVGMTDEVKKHLFEPFFTTKGPGEGTGMGLASVYGTVRNHGGATCVESEVGRGTTVQICLPLAIGATLPDAAGTAAMTGGTAAQILFVDDEPAIREMAKEMLGLAGYRVTTCADGREAIAHYREHWREIDLVILDMVMPETNGRDAFVAMRRINPHIRAILSSGHSLDGAAQAILDEGAIAFIAKPFLHAELLRAVTEALARRA